MPTGLPTGLGVIASAWCLGALPPSVYPFTDPPLGVVGTQTCVLVIATDAMQFVTHRLSHVMRSRSHSEHHKRTHPTVSDAFHTGWADALCQLMIPVLLSIWIIKPARESATAYGIFYGLWLQWIHSDNTRALACRSRVFVTPAHHRLHHIHPHKNFGHVLRMWDILCGTDATPSAAIKTKT